MDRSGFETNSNFEGKADFIFSNDALFKSGARENEKFEPPEISESSLNNSSNNGEKVKPEDEIATFKIRKSSRSPFMNLKSQGVHDRRSSAFT